MAKEIKTEILINASPAKVWEILTDFRGYPTWNPFIKSLTGNVIAGNRIETKIEPPGKKPMMFKPRVLAFDTNKELRWIGHLIVPGLFDGQSEKFSGILVPLFNKMLDVNTVNGFNLMNQKLKVLAEK